MENFVFSIIWERWAGKTQLSSIIASDYPVIYSNYQLKIKWKKVFQYTGTLSFWSDWNAYLWNIKLEKTNHKEIILVDEAWINYNSKKSQTQENMSFSEFVIVSRKYNKDLVFITTQDYSINKDFRFETNFWFNCQKRFDEDWNFYTLVEKLKLNRNTWNVDLLDDYKLYWIQLMKELGIEYDTTDIAKIQKEDNKSEKLKF